MDLNRTDNHGHHSPHTAIYINNSKLPPTACEHVPINHSDITAISIAPKPPLVKPSLIINVYNSHEQSLPQRLHNIFTREIPTHRYGAILVAGDFNLHHPLWNPQGYPRQDPEADTLVEAMMEAHLHPLLPAGTITFPTNNEQGGTAIDLVWGNSEAKNLIIKCHTVESTNDHASDHLPIETILDLQPKILPQPPPPFNYSKTNWDLLKQEIEQSLPPVINPHPTVQQLDEYAQQLISRITDAISKSTPRKRPSPHSKRWWTSDLSELRKHINRARNRYRRTRSETDGDEWREYRTVYKREIRQAKNRKWKEFIEEADEKTIWLAKRYIDKPPSPYYIPTINGATSNEGKANEFKETFFPPPPPVNIDDIPTATYPDSIPCIQTITINQIQTATNKISPKKALGPDRINN